MGVPRGARPPSQTAYYVALGGVLVLLLMLLAYCLFFFARRIKELASQPMPEPVKSVRPPPTAAYPVQPEVRESATAMARLCKQIPPSHTDTVFPTLSPNKPTMLSTPTPTSPRSPASCSSLSPARARPSTHANSPVRTRAHMGSPSRMGGHALSRSPGSKPMPLPPPKIIAQSPAKKRPSSMPDPPTPAISVSEVK